MEKKIAYKVSIVGIISNIFLSIFKLLAGIIGNSKAMISDAIHSTSDVLSTIVVIIGIKLSNKESDKEHPYGHERFECIASIILSFMLFCIGFLIGYRGIVSIINGQYKKDLVPGTLALVGSIVSIITKEAMYLYTKKWAKVINSSALLADSYHHRSDSLSSVGSLIGIIASQLGLPIGDSIASVVICIFIIKISIDIFNDTIDKLVDKSCDDDLINTLKKDIFSNKQVLKIDMLKTRIFGNKLYADIEISVAADLSLIEAHQISENVHDYLENKHKNLKHCMIHVNPYLEKETIKWI